MKQIEHLRHTVEELNNLFGPKSATTFMDTALAILQWVRDHGHGNLTVSVKDHICGAVIRADVVIKIDPSINK